MEMDSYTEFFERAISDIDPTDDDYEARLLEVLRIFRPFDEALDPFLAGHGYCGDIRNTSAKISFIKSRFEIAGIPAPRDIELWYEKHRGIRRETAFRICFAFGLNTEETEEFFRCVFGRERSFDCHSVEEAVYYFCIRNGFTYLNAGSIIERIPKIRPGRREFDNRPTLYTGTIRKEIDRMTMPEQLIEYLSENQEGYSYNNATAYSYIKRLWKQLTEENGLLRKEECMLSDNDSGKKKCSGPMRTMDAYRSLLGLEKDSVAALSKDGRAIKAILKKLAPAIEDSFPDRQGIEQILRGEHVSYERVRKWLILLEFFVYWLRPAIERREYSATPEEKERFTDRINRFLLDAGYMELYLGNPYDWIFLFAGSDERPIETFRLLWNGLIADLMEQINQ